MADRKLLFTVTAADCDWDYSTSSKGAGGQHRDKTASAASVIHRPSGARGSSQDFREQYRNKRVAFRKMCETPEMKIWINKMIAELEGKESVEDIVDRMMAENNITTQVRSSDGKRWITVALEDLRED